MLVELSVMERRYQAMPAVVQDGWKVVEFARRLGVSRQSVLKWISRYEQRGLASLVDRSHRPISCPHQTPAEVEALICELRREHPGWGRAASSTSSRERAWTCQRGPRKGGPGTDDCKAKSESRCE